MVLSGAFWSAFARRVLPSIIINQPFHGVGSKDGIVFILCVSHLFMLFLQVSVSNHCLVRKKWEEVARSPVLSNQPMPNAQCPMLNVYAFMPRVQKYYVGNYIVDLHLNSPVNSQYDIS